ncbi:meiosis arrest female protein 1 homolog isoform X2 [Mizuhopecten yessoensis]|uniref:Meiosis arrest female protein 1-like n=1 Tax=Mizuhopecten yessoensis TaxID=6573 RepID=A0A210QQ24_MIZYE|nr:meiosis arrest female protein 1 homolog isoform X2 [Mizuhopecten yessoensis]OWF50825.1 Meiosis arrest female protein 1-like [Mizuhopecten yessoensis]
MTSNLLAPIGVFWDIENCNVPRWKSALTIVKCIREKFFVGRREVEFLCVCDTTKENKQVIQDLNAAQVDVVHINATSKNAADDKLRQSLRRFTDKYPPPAVVLLISSDVNFASDLSDMRHRKGYHVILIHTKHVHEALKLCANEHFLYEDLVQDLPHREPDQSEEGQKELVVVGFPTNQPSKMVENCLKRLSTNCGGRVISVTASYALLRFPSHNDAVRAKKRMTGEQVFSSTIQVDFAVAPTDIPTAQGTISLPDKKDSSPDPKPKRRRYRRSKSREQPKLSPLCHKDQSKRKENTPNGQKLSPKKTNKAVKMTTESPSQVSRTTVSQGDTPVKDDGQSDIKTVVDKFSKDNKSSRQVLLLQQQLYQEGQETPPQARPQSQPTPDNKHSPDTSGFKKGQGHYSMFGQSHDDQLYQQGSSYGYYSHNTWGQNHYQSYSGYYGNNSGYYCNSTGYHGNNNTHNNNMDSQSFYGYNNNSFEKEGGFHPSNPDLNRSFCSSDLVRRPRYNSTNNTYRQHTYNPHKGLDYGPSPPTPYFNQRQSPYNNYAQDRQSPSYHSLDRQSPYQNTSYKATCHLLDRASPYMTAFQPIRSDSPSTTASSPCEQDSLDWDSLVGPVELLISNLDYNISAKEWRKILFTTFHPHVRVLNVHVKAQPDNTSIGMVKVPSKEEARFAISQFHRKKIGYKRIHVTLKNDEGQHPANTTRAEAVTLLLEAKDNTLPLFKFIELFDKRYHRSISVSELYKMRDVIDIREQGGAGRMVYLASRPQQTTPNTEIADGEVQEILEQPVCTIHCPEGSTMYAEAINSCMLPYVKMSIKMLGPQVHSLLQTHDGHMPLMSFPMCYIAEFSSLPISLQSQGGVPLEHLISCVPGIQIQVSASGVKKVQWAENQTSNATDVARPVVSPLLNQQLNQICREMTDLLKQSPQCRMPMSKFIPSYHHFFGRQCRVADYGYSRLKDLFEAIPHIVQVLGTGDRKLLTLSHRAQGRRFTADLTKLLKVQPGKRIGIKALPEAWAKFYNKVWDITEYGMSQLDDLLTEVPPTTAVVIAEGGENVIVIPRKDQSVEEVERTRQFSLEVVDLLRHNPQCRMPFNKFIPAYHHHFGRQCRVSDYGFSKLMDLFEAIPHVVEMEEDSEERMIHLTEPELRKILAEQVVSLLKYQKSECLPLHHLMSTFTCHYGFNIPLYDFNVETEEDLMKKLRHVVKVEMVNRCKYVMLVSKTEMPRLAHHILQLMMDQSGGSLPLVELASRYKSQYGHDCDIKQIKEELLDYVQVIGDDESAVISLTPLQAFARDVRLLLHEQGRLYLTQFERVYKERFGVELKPALFGYPTTLALLQTIPYIANIRGKGPRKYCTLSPEFKAGLPAYKDQEEMRDYVHRPASDTQSSDSGVTDNNPEDDELCVESAARKSQKVDLMSSHQSVEQSMPTRSLDLLSAPVPSAIPSPDLNPEEQQIPNLMTFDITCADIQERIWTLTDNEKRGQKTPLCRTPTSELLNFAAQCLISRPPPPASGGSTPSLDRATTPQLLRKGEQSQAEVTKGEVVDDQGWWKASDSQLTEMMQVFSRKEAPTRQEVDGAGPVRGREPREVCTTDTMLVQSGASASTTSSEKLENSSSQKDNAASFRQSQDIPSAGRVQTSDSQIDLKPASSPDTHIPVSTTKLPSQVSPTKVSTGQVSSALTSTDQVFSTKVSTGQVSTIEVLTGQMSTSLAFTENQSSMTCSPGKQVQTSAPVTMATSPVVGNKKAKKTETTYNKKSKDTVLKHKIVLPKCLPKEKTIKSLTDTACYDSIFRQEPPLDTSSVKSDTSTLSDVSQGSPRKSPRKQRIAARFDNPMEPVSPP